MRKMLLLAGMLCGALFLTGCGNDVDENKSTTQIKEEVSKMDASQIQAMVDKYQKAIEERAAELKVEADKLAQIPLTEQTGDAAKASRAKIEELKNSINRLKTNMEAYAEGLKKK